MFLLKVEQKSLHKKVNNYINEVSMNLWTMKKIK